MNTASFPDEPKPFDFDAGPHPIRAINELSRAILDRDTQIKELTRTVHSLQAQMSTLLCRISHER